MERRSLLDGEMTPTREREDVFGDEFEVEDFDMVADGFRPSEQDGEEASVRHADAVGEGETQEEDQPIRTVSAYLSSRPVSPSIPAGPSRNSIAKPRMPENPFASLDDDAAPGLSFESGLVHRSVSSASSQRFAGTSSPRFGAGPSHPYGMYPQSTMARSPSVATSSNVRPRATQPTLAGGPQHPYTLYPQGVTDDLDDEDDDMVQENPVPIGFTGLGQSYQRRRGPDGEELDIIGADGHTEQLPPYTRYPEDAPEKVPLLEVPAPPTALHSRAPVAGTDPTMDLMHTSIRPETVAPPRQSMTDASTLARTISRPGTIRSVRSVGDADSYQETAHSKKSWSEKSWKEKRKTRICGIPFWWILLSICVVGFVAAVLGGVIGGFVEQHKHHHGPMNSKSLYDATLLPTPITIAAPTGTFALSFSTPQQTQADCLTTSDQQSAWSCDLAGDLEAAAISVEGMGGNGSGAYIYYNSNPDQKICYGTQLSWMQSAIAPFQAVQDNTSPGSGPAYYFSQFYDKLVVVPETALNPSEESTSNKAKRQSLQLDQSWFQQKQIAAAGDKPWFCVWNNTFMEGFIYIQEPVPASYSLNSSSSSSSTGPPPSTSASSAATTPPSSSTPSPTSGPTTSLPPPPTSTSSTGIPTSAFSYHIAEQTGSNNHNKRQQQNDDDDNDDDTTAADLHLYPYVIKIEERRLSGNSVKPYCQQYQILDDGSYNWVANSAGEPIIIYLDESDPSYSAYQSAGIAGSSSSRKQKQRDKRLVAGGCHCQWVSGQSG